MRNRANWITFVLVVALTVFSVAVVWPNMPDRYLPNFVPWPEGQGLKIGGFERKAMRLGLDLKGGTYVLLEADTSRLPAGTDIDDALDGVKDVLERRVNAFGVSETEITREGPNRLAVQMPGIDPDQARELLGKTAQLEFRTPVRDDAGQIVCETPDGAPYARPYEQTTFVPDHENSVVSCPPSDEGAIGVVKWEPATGTDSQGTRRVLTGSYLKPNTYVITQPGGCGDGEPPCVAIEFTGEGGLLFEQVTGDVTGLPLAIFLDEELIGALTVQGQISGGQSTITGLNLDESKTLKIHLNAGALPVPMKAIQETEVDATLGERDR